MCTWLFYAFYAKYYDSPQESKITHKKTCRQLSAGISLLVPRTGLEPVIQP